MPGERGNCVPFKKGKKERGSCDHLLIISEDVLIQILLWLPVISLLRFKSVCKSWRSIIESPFFIHLHATTTTTTTIKLGGSSLLNYKERCMQVEEKISIFFTLSGDELEVFNELDIPPSVEEDLGDEFEVSKNKRFVRFCVVGCWNGIICLHDNFRRNIILWNPEIKQSRVLPKPSNLLGNPYCYSKSYLNPHDDDGYYTEDVVAFGVDAKTKDYKVLLITTLQPPPHATYSGDEDMKYRREHRIHVYSLSTDSWRCIESLDITLFADYPDDVQIDDNVIQGMYLSGSHFFMASCQIKVDEHFCTMPLILSLDLTAENFKTIPLPFDWRKRKTCESTYFIPFGEKLALVDVSECECKVWVLKEEHSGVKESSWTKLYTLRHPYRSPIQLRSIPNEGEFAIIYWEDPNVRELRLLNLITGEIKDLQSDCQCLQVDFGVGSIYRPSLVQIGRSGATTNEKCDSTL